MPFPLPRGERPRRRSAGPSSLVGCALPLAVGCLLAGGCRPAISEDSPLGARVSLTGAGAGFPAILYQSWAIALYTEMPELKINYQSMGSGAGVKQMIKGVVDFAGSDVAMTDAEIAQTPTGVMLLPMTAGAVVLAYHLPELRAPLRLSRSTYVGILLGTIAHWRAPEIARDNPGATFPDRPITVVHRSDGAGSTAVLTAHLAAISDSWASSIGVGKNVDWPRTGRFIGTKGNDGVVTQILQLPGAIGYLDYAFAANNDVGLASLENRAGNFVAPTHTAAEASLGMSEMPEDMRLFITDPEGPDSYPVVTYTWLLVRRRYADPLKAKALEIFVEHGLNEGQEVAPILGYAPLPQGVRERVAALADHISPDYGLTLGRRDEP